MCVCCILILLNQNWLQNLSYIFTYVNMFLGICHDKSCKPISFEFEWGLTCFKIYMSSVFVCNVNLSCECVSCNSFFHHHNRLQIIRSSFIYVSFVFLWYVFWVGCQDGGYYWLTPWNCDVNWFCRFCFGQRGGLMTEIQMWCPV